MIKPQPPPPVLTFLPEPEGARRGGAWQAAWALSVALGAALMLIWLGAAPLADLAALGCGVVPGLLGWAFRPRPERAGGLLILWAAACAFAMALTGGVSGPLMAWGLAPMLAAAVIGAEWRDGVLMSFAAFTGVALIQAAGKTAATPLGVDAFVLGLICLATILGGAGAALMLLARQQTTHRPGPAPAPASTEPNPRSLPEPAPVAYAARDPALEARLLEAERARAAAETDAQSKMRFLANMSHELRTPLNAIMGFSDIMRSRLFGELPPKYGEYAELIHESGRHLLDLINDVLDMSKIEADKYVLDREVFDVRDAVNAALRIVRVQADEAGVQLRGVLPAAELEVDADSRALKQIVLNLVSNALKFTPAGGSVTITVHAAVEALEIVVADTGVGIAPEDLERLGRPFEQAGDADHRARGSGLGLSLVKAFARLHGGDMNIESRLGEGTAVTVRLPVLHAAEPPVSAA